MTASPLPQVVYLHGFASSAQSSKAQYFGERCAEVGITVHTPDLNLPEFETLTITRMIEQVEVLVGGLPAGPVVLMGSSMGAFVAWHAASRLRERLPSHPVTHLVLLAPAVTFGVDRDADFGSGVVDAWERAGVRTFFHYAYDAPRTLRYEFYRDAVAWRQADRDVHVPTLVFQGTHDEVVRPEGVQAFFAGRPHATVEMLDDGHQLLNHLDRMWERTRQFLGV
jgi:pimeloyl-ACP methyl ester carboxylesterase